MICHAGWQQFPPLLYRGNEISKADRMGEIPGDIACRAGVHSATVPLRMTKRVSRVGLFPRTGLTLKLFLKRGVELIKRILE